MQTVLQEEKDPLFVMRDYCIINLMIRTGLREIEIVRLNIEDMLHFENDLSYVHKP